ncbi:hypothetical protein RJ640_021663 [Escallonia rubra]|uniref:Uncharacterized protein n=1 Tax=Escallonia rubra TaxID=112253 RepID=A0AA88QKN1_9ASTE|nr:hypothetical protein RJ640_021663 [Escallonia rubra]
MRSPVASDDAMVLVAAQGGLAMFWEEACSPLHTNLEASATSSSALASKPEVGSSINTMDGFETSSTAIMKSAMGLRRGIMKPPNRNITSKEKRAEDAATDGFRNTEAMKRNDDMDT